MARPGAMRRIVRWTTLGATVFLPVVWIASVFWNLSFEWASAHFTAHLGTGYLDVFVDPSMGSRGGPWLSILQTWSPTLADTVWLPRVERRSGAVEVEVPLWVPWLIVGALCVWFMSADNRDSDVECLWCGYDRRGLSADAKCPECGAKATNK